MKIAFYKGLKSKRLVDTVICLSTFSKYSHCEIVFSDGMSASSSRLDKGVRFKYIDYENSDKWDVYEIVSPYGEEAEKAIRYYFQINEGDTYNHAGAVLSAFGLALQKPNKKWCSEICAEVLGEKPTTPGKLFRVLKKNWTI